MSFQLFDLHPTLKINLAALGYQEPTPIQAEAIPVVLAGRDVLGLAQTGTGKTAAFALPILHRLQAAEGRRLRVLVLAPTRELAEQIHEVFGALGRDLKRSSMTLYGGVGMAEQVRQLEAGVDIVVACPGRLLDHLQQGTIRLDTVEVLVIDEADRMFDMGFLPNLRQIIQRLPRERQTLLFSATMPEDIRHLAAEVLRDAVTVRIGVQAPVETVSHALYPVPPHLKTKLLLELLKRTSTDSVLVFTRTKHRANRVGAQLRRAGFRAAVLQGNLSQNRRREALAGFRDGRHQVLVATDIAARGLDVTSISHVINFDMPDTVDAYTHRIGRTGRAASTGDAFTLVTPDDAGLVRDLERVIGAPLERRQVEGFDYSVPPPQQPAPRPARPDVHPGDRRGPGHEPRPGGGPGPRHGKPGQPHGGPGPRPQKSGKRPPKSNKRPPSSPPPVPGSSGGPSRFEPKPITLTVSTLRGGAPTGRPGSGPYPPRPGPGAQGGGSSHGSRGSGPARDGGSEREIDGNRDGANLGHASEFTIARRQMPGGGGRRPFGGGGRSFGGKRPFGGGPGGFGGQPRSPGGRRGSSGRRPPGGGRGEVDGNR